ncbi:MAG: ABC transporter permease [Gemmatimonadetes bacterium]|nr:ABC transporter permease [Gemmatimonadota bacterium]
MAHTPFPVWISRAVYRRLALVYPKSFRRQFGDQLFHAFDDACRAAWHGKRLLGLAKLWMATLVDLAVEGSLERMKIERPLRTGGAPHPTPRTIKGASLVESMLQDLRFALRSLFKAPGFTAVVVLTLAVGIGANTAIFSVVNGIILRPLPFDHPEELVLIWGSDLRTGSDQNVVSPLNFEDWRDMNAVFTGMAAATGWGPTLSGDGDAVRLSGNGVSEDMFAILGVTPVLGRLFAKDDGPVAIVTHDLWTNKFGADSGLIGRELTLSGVTRTVVGVLPPEFRFPINQDAEIFTIMRLTEATRRRDLTFLRVFARMKPGVDLEQAQMEMTAIARQLEEAYPEANTESGAHVMTLHDNVVGHVENALYLLLGAVGFVLLIASANVANLLLARASARDSEMAVRAALGAGRGRLFRQLATESMLLAVAGGMAGVALARWGIRALLALSPPDIPRLDQVAIDTPVLAFSLAVTLFTGLAFGILPAVHASRPHLAQSMKSGGRQGGPTRRGLRLRRGLVVSQVAIGLVLLVGSGLLIRSFGKLLAEDTGFDGSGVLTGRVSLSAEYDTGELRGQFYTTLLERVDARPETAKVAAVLLAPFDESNIQSSFEIAGRPTPLPNQSPVARLLSASEDVFGAMRIPVLAGRVFEPTDRKGSIPVAVVNQAAVDQYWSGEDPVGQRITLGIALDGDETEREIVGVVGNALYDQLDEEAGPQVYVPYKQYRTSRMSLVVRTHGDPFAFVPTLRSELRALDPNLAFVGLNTFDRMVSQSVAVDRFYAILLSVFAAVAVLLGAVGLYGVLSYAVVQRTNEMGIRVALGASRSDVLRLVVGEGIKLVGVGIGVGLVAALLLTRLMESLLYGISATDPATFGATGAFLAAVAILASYIPARRAGRVNPVEALRHE